MAGKKSRRRRRRSENREENSITLLLRAHTVVNCVCVVVDLKCKTIVVDLRHDLTYLLMAVVAVAVAE